MRKLMLSVLVAGSILVPASASAAWELPELSFCALAEKLGVVFIKECEDYGP